MDDVIVDARGHMAAKQQASIVRGHQSPQPHANKKDDKHPGDNPARAPCPRKKLLHHRDRKHHGHTPKQGMVCQRGIKMTGKKRQARVMPQPGHGTPVTVRIMQPISVT